MISHTAEYALRAMVFLAEQKEATTGEEIAHTTKLPSGFLSKILRQLARAKLITSKKGMGGGFVLARQPFTISLLEVINAVDPIEEIKTCPLGIKSHGNNLCPLHKRLSDTTLNVKTYFSKSNLEDLTDESLGLICTKAYR